MQEQGATQRIFKESTRDQEYDRAIQELLQRQIKSIEVCAEEG